MSVAKYSKHCKCSDTYDISNRIDQSILFDIACWCVAPNPTGKPDKRERWCERMANRSRTIRKEIAFTVDEWEMIETKLNQLGTNNFSMYGRKMCIDGYVIKRDFSELKALTKELANLSRSINQIVKRANETRHIYEQDLRDIQSGFYEVKRKVSERLVKMLRE